MARESNSLANRASNGTNGKSLLPHRAHDGTESGDENVSSHDESHDSRHEGLVNLKISSILKNDRARDSSSPSSSSPVSINNDSSAGTASHVMHHNSSLDETVNR